MASGTLRIATCQFAVSHRMAENAKWICRLIRQAADRGGEIVHFPEAALTGYAGTDLPGFNAFDWGQLRGRTEEICGTVAERKVWAVVGSAHQLSATDRPHNCLYLIGPNGRIRDRYDKRLCMPRDLEHYTPGEHVVTFEVNGVRCGLLICFEVRFPEVYRDLYVRQVRCVLQSFYNARQHGPSVHADIMRQTLQAHAACNAFWASLSNASGWYSPYPSCFIRPDGRIARQLRGNRPGVMVNTVDLNEEFYDPMKGLREGVIDGILRNGPKGLEDPRSMDRTSL